MTRPSRPLRRDVVRSVAALPEARPDGAVSAYAFAIVGRGLVP